MCTCVYVSYVGPAALSCMRYPQLACWFSHSLVSMKLHYDTSPSWSQGSARETQKKKVRQNKRKGDGGPPKNLPSRGQKAVHMKTPRPPAMKHGHGGTSEEPIGSSTSTHKPKKTCMTEESRACLSPALLTCLASVCLFTFRSV